MQATRREFLALSAAVSAAGAVLGFPIPLRQLVPSPLLPLPSDALPPLPDGAIRRLGSRRFRTGRSISRLQFAPHGKVLVAADRDEIRGWETATARPIFSMPYPARVDLNSGRVTNCNSLVTLARVENAAHYEIHHYSWATGQAETKATTTLPRVEIAAFSADGSRVAAMNDGKLHVYDGRKTRELWTAAITEFRSADMAFIDGDKLLVISALEGLRIFEVETGKERAMLKTEPRARKGRGGGAAVDGLVASPDGQFLAGIAGANRDRILVWNATPGELIRTIEEKEPGSLLGFTPDGGTLFAHRGGSLNAYSLSSGKLLRTLDIGPNQGPQLSPCGKLLANTANDAVLLFDLTTGQLHPLSADPPGLPAKLHYVGPHTLVGLLMEYGGWMQWDLTTGSSKMLRPKTLGDGVPVAISDDDRVAIVAGGDKLRRWDLVTGEEQASVDYAFNRSVPLADLSRDGRRIVAPDEAGLKVWDARSGQSLPVIPANACHQDADAIAISADSSTVALAVQIPYFAASHLVCVEIYHLRTARIMTRITGIAGQIDAIQLSPDGSRVAVLTEGRWHGNRIRKSIGIYDARTGSAIQDFYSRLTNPLSIFAISPDNRLVAIATDNHRLTLWELSSGEQRFNNTLPGEATALAFAPDSATLAVAASGGPLLIWDLRGRSRAKPVKPDAATGAKLLDWLGDKDGPTAYEALRIMAAWPDETLPLLAKAIPAVMPPDPAKLKECIEKLGSSVFAERDKATRELIAFGELAVPSLNAVLAETASAEVRSRAEMILSRGSGGTLDLRTARALEAAEWAGTPLAKQLLKTWAAGATGARLTDEAKAALRRLGN